MAKNLKDFPHVKHSQLFKDLVIQAKEMEKEQLSDAWYAGDEDGAIHEFEQYYNETFKSE